MRRSAIRRHAGGLRRRQNSRISSARKRPYTLAESLFIPLRPLIEASYPPHKLHFIMLDRDPASSLASWLDKLRDRAPAKTLIHDYVIAVLNTLRVESNAGRLGIPVTHYVYETSKEAVSSVRALFDRLGLSGHVADDAVTDWRKTGQLHLESPRIIFPDEPALYKPDGLHGSDTAYRYRARTTASLSDNVLDLLERCGVNEIYRASVKACVRDLGLDAATSKRLFGDCIGGMSENPDVPTVASAALAGVDCGDCARAASSHLQRLEADSIFIMREVAAEFQKPVMLYSIGKDSSVLLHLAMKAFHPGKPPFPLLHVDTNWKFREMIAFRDQRARELGLDLLVHVNPDGVSQGIGPFSHGSALHTDVMKTQALRQALDHYGFDAAIGGGRDEEKSRAKERIFSHRSAAHRWDPKNQRPELWNLYNTMLAPGESMRVFPLSNWTELDIWEYILIEQIPVVPLYLAAPRLVVERDGALIMVDDERMQLRAGEQPRWRSVRFRTLGCYPLTGAVESTATTVSAVVEEMMGSRSSERQGRVIDRDSAASMDSRRTRASPIPPRCGSIKATDRRCAS
jgi:sulfate adenylyltransferase subunit 2